MGVLKSKITKYRLTCISLCIVGFIVLIATFINAHDSSIHSLLLDPQNGDLIQCAILPDIQLTREPLQRVLPETVILWEGDSRESFQERILHKIRDCFGFKQSTQWDMSLFTFTRIQTPDSIAETLWPSYHTPDMHRIVIDRRSPYTGKYYRVVYTLRWHDEGISHRRTSPMSALRSKLISSFKILPHRRTR